MATESIKIVKIEFSDESRKAIADMLAQVKEIQKTLDRIGEQYVKQASKAQRSRAGR